MKTLFIIVISLFISLSSFSQITNGWLDSNVALRISILENKISEEGKKDYLLAEKTKLENILKYQNLTSALLSKFREIVPAMMETMDSLKDDNDNKIKVYVRVVHWSLLPDGVNGSTNFTVKDNIHYSRYGKNSVEILVSNNKKKIYTLAHEFGHAFYQINNLVKYKEYFANNYSEGNREYGHLPGDRSGEMAEFFESNFAQHYRELK